MQNFSTVLKFVRHDVKLWRFFLQKASRDCNFAIYQKIIKRMEKPKKLKTPKTGKDKEHMNAGNGYYVIQRKHAEVEQFLHLTSGYRCEAVNRMVGGVCTSATAASTQVSISILAKKKNAHAVHSA